MNDRLKFRAWDERTKTYFNNAIIEALAPISVWVKKGWVVKLIYEGDIVKTYNWFLGKPTPDEIAVIEWNSQYACYVVLTKTGEYDFSFYDGDDVEIIGNIHENPELLECK